MLFRLLSIAYLFLGFFFWIHLFIWSLMRKFSRFLTKGLHVFKNILLFERSLFFLSLLRIILIPLNFCFLINFWRLHLFVLYFSIWFDFGCVLSLKKYGWIDKILVLIIFLRWFYCIEWFRRGVYEATILQGLFRSEVHELIDKF